MLIIDRLLLLPVTAPVAGIRWCLQQAVTLAEAELMDDSAVKDELLELQMLLETGDITEEDYETREAVLMLRLREIRAYRARQAGRAEDESDAFISYS
ncbi:MAG TPA: gas vesicle protein GvpG [Chloroflexota bacterium]|nr:gas vesicle protein GvpG [Chloroflexota bacterium]